MTYSATDFSDDVMRLAADLGVISQDYAENEDLADNEELAFGYVSRGLVRLTAIRDASQHLVGLLKARTDLIDPDVQKALADLESALVLASRPDDPPSD